MCDELGKEVELQDFQLDPAVFDMVTSRLGLVDVDQFADAGNAQLPKFRSRWFCDGTMGVDALAHSWKGERSWVFPPFEMIARTIYHMQLCGARGILVVPDDASQAWWPRIGQTAAGFGYRLRMKARRGLVRRDGGRTPCGALPYDLLAIAFDFSRSRLDQKHDMAKSACVGEV